MTRQERSVLGGRSATALRLAAFSLAGLGLLLAWSAPASAVEALRAPFSTMPDGRAAEIITLRNAKGMTARVITYGATLQSVDVPDRKGHIANVILTHPDLQGYLKGGGLIGATVGRYANRIKNGAFSLDDVPYKLASTSHGGPIGFYKRLWTVESVEPGVERARVTLSLVSPDGDQGFPGELTVWATYSLNESNDLTIEYTAVTTRPTIVNLTNHAYFNLAGADGPAATGQQLRVEADYVTEVDDEVVPTGRLNPVAGGPLDFRTFRTISERIGDQSPQMVIGKGYNHNFVVRGGATARPKPALELRDVASGRELRLLTTEPGVQVYTGMAGGVAIEPQHYPDSPNHPDFPTTRLDPGQVYRHTSVYQFRVQR